MATERIARSCDTFVVLPPLTDSSFRIFGKNSDRPTKEVQEVILVSDKHHGENSEVVHVTGSSARRAPSVLMRFTVVYTHPHTPSFAHVSMRLVEACLVLGRRDGRQ